MNKNIFDQKTIDIIDYIANDINNVKNPIKYYNKIYNKHFNENNINIKNLFDKLINILQNIDQSSLENTILENNNSINLTNINWTNIDNNYPYIYNAFNKLFQDDNKSFISFDKFNDLYNKKKFNINDFTEYYDNYLDKQFNHIFLKKINLLEKQSNNIYEIIDILKYFQYGSFISLDIKHYVETNINNCDIYEFDHLKLYFFSSVPILTNTVKYNIIKHIFIVSKWMYSIKYPLANSANNSANSTNSTNKIKFIYFDCPIEKTINLSKKFNDFKYLSSQNINSGLSSSNNLLMIWRREEFIKVLIHELIHYLDIDVKYDSNFDKLFTNIGEINYPILVNETITEIQAQFLHTIYVTNNLTNNLTNNANNTNNPNNEFDTFKLLYQYEHIFSWYQFAKIMEYYQIEKFKKKYIKEKFNQSTNAYSYYILKSIFGLDFATILLSLDHFNILIKDKENNCNVNSCKIIVKHIIKTFKNPKKILKFINKIIKRLELFNNTLRMTIFTIDI